MLLNYAQDSPTTRIIRHMSVALRSGNLEVDNADAV